MIFDKALSAFTISGSPGALTITGDGIDTLNGIGLLRFGGATVDMSNYQTVQGGGANNDTFTARAGSELITGGAGLDVVKYSGVASAYQVGASGAGVIVSDHLGNGGDDLLAGVERIEFADHTGLALDVNGAAGQLYRVYEAMLNRAPDPVGLGFWLNALDHGAPLLSVSSDFITSDEFKFLYGANASNQTFVTALYRNVLHREPDASGMAYWLSSLDHGGPRADVLLGFSESAENIEVFTHIIPVGIAYTPVA